MDVSDTLVDPSLVSVIGITSTDKKAVKSPVRASSREKSKEALSCQDIIYGREDEAMDQKSSKHFSRLEAFLLSKSLEKPSPEPTFKTVKIPVKTPPASAVKVTEPFVAPQPANRPAVSTNQIPAEVQCDQPRTTDLHQPTD